MMRKISSIVFFSWLCLSSLPAEAGSFVFAGASNGIDLITHPSGYTGTGGRLDVKVCIVPGSPQAADMVIPVRNSIAYWNKRQPTTSNLRPLLSADQVDFESIFVHELGHCIGLAHPNLATESGQLAQDRNYTQSTQGADNIFGLNSGGDSIKGSVDDLRGDDENLHWFRKDNNNPFSIQAVIDASTYVRDLASLPSSHQFAANADRDVSLLFAAPHSEVVMQQGAFSGEAQRTLVHDDVATLRLAMSGLDETADSVDDYTVNLLPGDISNAADCDIHVSFDNSETGFAVCKTTGQFVASNPNHAKITSAEIYFNTEYNWFFNNTAPCSESLQLTAGEWRIFSLPCQVGISTGNTLEAILGDDMAPADYDQRWVVYRYVPATNSYHKLALTEIMQEGVGYWLYTLDSDITVTVTGEYPSNVDQVLDTAPGGQWNLVGMPFRHDTAWANAHVIDTDGAVLSLSEADLAIAPGGQRACNVTPVHSSCVVASTAYRWNGARSEYDILTASSAKLSAFDGMWVYAVKPGVALRLPMSSLERATP